jgi:Domain of unknown function (DU1801)
MSHVVTTRSSMSNSANKTEAVNVYMTKLDYPLKAEAEAIRETIKGINQQITEQVKWNAPSFSYKGAYLVTFNLRNPKRILLVFHHPAIAGIKSDWLEGDYPDRRLAYLGSMDELQAQKGELVRIITHLVNVEDDK